MVWILMNLSISHSGAITTINRDHAMHCTASKFLPLQKYIYKYLSFRKKRDVRIKFSFENWNYILKQMEAKIEIELTSYKMTLHKQ